jgi:Hairy Orange
VKSEASYADRFRDGFSQCAKEVTKFLYNSQQSRAGEHIIVHLNDCMRRLDGLTNAAANMQINNNNNNYIANDNLQLELNHQQQPFVSLHHQQQLHQNAIRQPIPMLRKSPIPPQNYLPPLPSTSPQASMESPIMLRTISRESMSSTSSNDQNKEDASCWRPW